jgi:MoaA/NifB/PqqE/SkfB family radical SAM enzyme
MLNIYDPTYYKEFAIDLTNKCNGKCRFCPRNTNSLIEKQIDLKPEVFYKIFDKEYIKNIDRFVINGNLGEPTLSKYLIEYLEYISIENPRATIWLSTNGSTRNDKWWSDLAETLLFNDKNTVRFCLDGLEDTNIIHRGTDFYKVIKNMGAFNENGGRSEWQFILFEHNEHQVDQAKRIADSIGCSGFVSVVSRRYDDLFRRPKTFDVKTKHELCEELKQDIFCTAIDLKNLYLSHEGKVFPCCDYALFTTWPRMEQNHTKMYIEYLKSIKQIDMNYSNLTEAINSPFFRYIYENIQELTRCNKGCRLHNNNHNTNIMREENLIND